jgi:hypothetical protein
MAKSVEELLEENNRLLRSSLTGRGTGGLNLPDPTKAISGTYDAFEKLTMGTYSLQDGLRDTSSVLSILPGVGDVVGGALSKVGNSAIVINDSLKDVAKSGYGFDRDLGQFAVAVTGARMSLPEFQNFVKENGRALAGLAGTASNSAAVFLKLGKDLNETDAVRNLVATGMGFDEFNKILAISTANRRGTDLRTEASQKTVVDAAVAMASEMDNVARLTGISRQEQQRAVETQMKKNEVEIATMAMDDKEASTFAAQTASLGKYGKQVQDVYTALSTGGLRTAEDTAKAAAIGPEFTRLATQLAAANKDTSAGAEDRRRAIQQQMDNELLRIVNDKDELRNRAALATSGGEYGKQQAEFVVNAKAYASALKNIAIDADKNGITVEEQRKKVNEKFAKELEDAGKGKGPTGTEAASLINRAEALMKDASAGAALGFKDINTRLIDTVPGLDKLNDALKKVKVEDSRELADRAKNVLAPKSKPVSELGPDLTPKPGREALGSKDVFGDWFGGPRNRLTYLAEDEVEASVPLSKVKQFIGDMSKKMPMSFQKPSKGCRQVCQMLENQCQI